ncbi:TetR/AcrR family transcriptional regulator [Micromonospora sp. NBC_01796]|uniref:TetR/AcrR family transcriptional regulator n=1 Tax=Micromonospora sp. NBC_01796 TaxID=2975987 RepID=UPI002DDA5175|nr:TetR/AcrR family transcriptional regulator [Micromonospora sp. NBC_01796]WSA84159.1 TetR/AcrR family transcriptional regulator [Micromonospora sp. NBC_01796]
MTRNHTREDILSEAARLFARVGFKGTSLHDIAVAVGCSKATLLYHFASKDALLVALVEPAVQELRALDDRLATLVGEDARAVAIDGFVDLVLRYRPQVTLVYDSLQLTEMSRFPGIDALAERLVRAFAGHSADPVDDIAARVVLSGICTVVIEHANSGVIDLRDALTTVAERVLPSQARPRQES